MASTNNYINEYATLDEMNAAYESDHSGSWVAYCAEDNNLYYQQKTSISSKYFDNLEYNSENKTLDFYIDGEVKKTIDVSPWWFEKDSYYTREESDAKYINNIGTSGNSLTYTIGDNTNNVTVPYATHCYSAENAYNVSSYLDWTPMNQVFKYRDYVQEDSTNYDTLPNGTIGIREWYGCFPKTFSSVTASTEIYPYGETVSLGAKAMRFDLYTNHLACENGNGIYYRTGWDGFVCNKWAQLLDENNYKKYNTFNSITIGNTTLSESQLQSLLNLI